MFALKAMNFFGAIHAMVVGDSKIITTATDGTIECHSRDVGGFEYDQRKDIWIAKNIWKNRSRANTSKKAVSVWLRRVSLQNDCDNLDPEENNVECSADNSWHLMDAQHIVVIGDTGVGKSSLVKLLTNDPSIQISNSCDPKSCTKHTSRYEFDVEGSDQGEKALRVKIGYIYDTKGTQDSEVKSDDIIDHDHQVLNEIQRYIYENHGFKLKIIWIVKNDNKASNNLQKQAKFISKFENTSEKKEEELESKNDRDQENTSVWDSVLLCVHKPHEFESLPQCGQGAIAAAKKHGCQREWVENESLIGYTNIDWIDNNNKSRNTWINSLNKQQRREVHRFTSDEIKSLVCYNLKAYIKCHQIIWRKDKCTRCNLVGDGRFFNDKFCHAKKRKRHKLNVISNHLGIIDKKNHSKKCHKGKLIDYHPAPPSRYYHKQVDKRKWIHPNNLAAYFYSTNERNGAIAAFVRYITSPVCAPIASMFYQTQNKCFYCNKNKTQRKGCLETYQCCDQYVNKYDANGCTTYPNDEMKYLCCGQIYDKNGNNNGCRCYYSCYYSCCPETDTSKLEEKGMNHDKYQCPPCATKCEGCNTVISNCDSKDDKNGIKNGDNCGFYWPCCEHKGKWEDRDKDEFKCYVVCNACNQPWGKSAGCVPVGKRWQHEIVSLDSCELLELID